MKLEPFQGVNVSLKNSTKGSTTDLDGKYLFFGLQDGNVVIIASYIGYKTTQTNTKINGNTVQNISLLEDANVLDDVVVTGVVNPKSRLESSVSVSSIGIKQIEQSAPDQQEKFFKYSWDKAESSGGEGNAFNVRGVPVSSGGSDTYNCRRMDYQVCCLEIRLLATLTTGYVL
jgi:hypothetical protein